MSSSSRPRARVPGATYRLQLRPGFGFDEAAAVAPYVAALGATHVYCSPYLQAAPGSTHGYDVVDPGRVNDELGGPAAHSRMQEAFARAGLGQVLDIVPNHMAITAENAWWWDVLENGPSSLYASHFDVDWDPPESKLRNTVLMPVLGDHYGRVLEAGELRLVRSGGSFTVHYHDHVLPVAPRSLEPVLAAAAAELDRARSGAADSVGFLASAFEELPPATATDRPSVRRRHRDKEVLRSQLERLCRESAEVARAVDAAVARTNADPDLLDEVLERQNYRLAFWRTAGRELDYRRFFDVTTLAGLRVEDEQVFADTHGLVLDWLTEGVLDGIRIDHPDGLRLPGAYFHRLREAAPEAWVVVEKILEPGEHLPVSWPVDGTTGYDFLNQLGGLFVDPAAEDALTGAYGELTGEPVDYAAVAYERKHQVMREVLGADLNRLTNLFVQVGEGQRRWRDYTRHELHEVLREVIACFPVYRTYTTPGEPMAPADAEHLGVAIAAATERRPDLDPDLFDFLRRLLSGGIGGNLESELMLRFQQVTGPVMAKGIEDTTFYNYNRLVALNEVGGDPARFGVTPEQFHREMALAQDTWPHRMVTTSTHDTKRSEDVRARLALLSELPDEWAAAVRRWGEINERHRTPGVAPDGGAWPDRNMEYLLYQTFVGAHPLGVDRAVAYAEKASREAKTHTSWIDPVEEYDIALRRFVEGVLADREFLDDLEGFVTPLVEPGRVNSLAQALVKLTAPGAPDVYQGTEIWDLSLVDPDNRRPVDYALRQVLLGDLAGAPIDHVLAESADGVPKLHVTTQALHLRRRRPGAFGADGVYTPLIATGDRPGHAVAFARGDEVVTVVPRLVLGLQRAGGWGETMLELPPGVWRNLLHPGDALKGGVRLAALLGDFPVALLEREDH